MSGLEAEQPTRTQEKCPVPICPFLVCRRMANINHHRLSPDVKRRRIKEIHQLWAETDPGELYRRCVMLP